ncbi:MAG TPA: hypothetical protein VF691_19330, partial [Cytophagaceae bacterium]
MQISPNVLGGVFTNLYQAKTGKIYVAGSNFSGMMGEDNSNSSTLKKVKLPKDVSSKQISTGFGHALMVSCDGKAYSWGSNTAGQLGNGVIGGPTNKTDNPVPSQVNGGATGKDFLEGVKELRGFNQVSYAIMNSNSKELLSWGEDAKKTGELGNGTTEGSSSPTYVLKAKNTKLTNVKSVNGSAALLEDGTVWMWGSKYGQTGANPYATQVMKKQGDGSSTLPLTEITEIAAGDIFVLALDKNDDVWIWGQDFDGSNESHIARRAPGISEGTYLSGIKSIAAGEFHMLALQKETGKVLSAGDNVLWTDNTGQLGLGPNVPRQKKARYVLLNDGVTELSGITEISTSRAGSFAYSANQNKYYGWGNNTEGQLGLGHSDEVNYATELPLEVLGEEASITYEDRSDCDPTVELTGKAPGYTEDDKKNKIQSVKWTSNSGTFSNEDDLVTTFTKSEGFTGDVIITFTHTKENPKDKKEPTIQTAEVTVKFKNPPTASVTSNTISSCGSSAINLGGSVSTGASATWSTETSGSFSPNNTTAGATFTPTGTLPSSATFTLTASSSGCSSDVETVTVNFTSPPTASVTSNTISSCGSSAINLGGSVSTGASATWSTEASGSFSPNNTTAGATFTPTGTLPSSATFTLTASSSGCSSDVETVTVNFIDGPTVTLELPPSVCT